MRSLAVFSVLCLIGALNAMPVSENDDEKLIIPREFFDKSPVKYKAKYDIVDIIVPLNGLNFDESSSSDSDSKSESDENSLSDVTVFLVEADLKDGKRVDKGLYLFKNDEAKMILPNGRAAAASSNDNKLVYFGASDGLYVYKYDSKSAEKYGSISDSIIDIGTDEFGKNIYILSEDHKLYNISNKGEKKEILEEIEDAQQFVLDDSANIYFYDDTKNVFIKNSDGIIKVQGLPEQPKSVRLIRPPFIMEESVPLILDNALYIVYANGTSEAADLEFSPNAKPTAYGADALLVQYYAINKKLYEFNIIALIANETFEGIKEQAESIRSNAEKSKNVLGSKRP